MNFSNQNRNLCCSGNPCAPRPNPCAPIIICNHPPPVNPCPSVPNTIYESSDSSSIYSDSNESSTEYEDSSSSSSSCSFSSSLLSSSSSSSSVNCCNNFIDDAITLDIAVLCQDYSPVEVASNNNHIIELDEICIDEQLFKNIFYPYGENFGLEKKNGSHPTVFPYITFLPTHRTIHHGQPFSLLEQIILNIENDLNVTRNCFTTSTLLELSKELSSIKSLCDIECCSLLSSLPWSNVLSIIKNNYISRNTSTPIKQTILIISVIFKTPNSAILPTIIKFKYKMNINTDWVK